MSQNVSQNLQWTLASVELQDAYTYFVLSRQAMQVSPATEEWYSHTASLFVKWLETQSVTGPDQVTGRHVRAYLAELAGRKLADSTLNGHARAIKTLLRFWHAENYMTNPVKIQMPKIAKKRLPVLDADQVGAVVKVCKDRREKALFLFTVDTGLRLAEIVSLSWENIDMQTGIIHLPRGKGGKARTVIAGASARRALAAYRRTLEISNSTSPLFQTKFGMRYQKEGLFQLFHRLSLRSGIKFSPHALRRTFCILSLRAGINVLHLQALMGHSSLEMTQHYAQLLDEDILAEHQEHSPIDNLNGLKRKR